MAFSCSKSKLHQRLAKVGKSAEGSMHELLPV
jgi:hypothetical protein